MISGGRKIRVNAISAGPMNTLAARGIGGFSKMLDHYEARAPLHRNVELEELGATGLFLATRWRGGDHGADDVCRFRLFRDGDVTGLNNQISKFFQITK